MRTNITSSAAGVVALLHEPEAEVKVFALNKLNNIVDVFWAEISEELDTIEMLYEDTSFKSRNLAALVASKVYYHLGSFEDSLTFALGADDLFDVNNTSEYVQTTISKCIDHYTKLRVTKLENEDSNGDNQVEIDPRLEAVVNRMFQRCFDDQQYRQAIGIAIETRRIDVFERAITKSPNMTNNLFYALKVCMSLIQSRQFRNVILRILVKLYMGLKTPDYVNVCQCLIFLEDPQAVAEILENLLKTNTDKSTLMAYQIGFDLYENATQQFVQRIQAALRATAPIPIISPASTKINIDAEGQEGSMEVEESAAPATAASSTPKLEDLSDVEKGLQERVTKLHAILGGDTTIALHLQFLIRTNKADPLILKKTKEVVRNSVCHNATVIANAYMYAGTTSDQFLRDNLEWLSRATNWAKFTATASLGVIHKGHENEALNLMSTYLPKETGPGSAYAEGGGLYALGLIHVNHGGDMSAYLLDQLKEASTDVVRHGGCLGLGLATMGTARQDIYEQLKFNLYQDDAITGEAAGIAMGLVMVGTKSAMAIEDMVAYAQETQHEKILRGLAVGIALTMYSRQEEADSLIDSLMLDKDPILRRSGMYTIAMAYCGTGDNAAIRRLLHVAVSDVDDDVRRAAVTSIGFLLFRTPEQCPSVVSLLSESYNPHVRFGAAMALGTACAGTGLKEALALLEPMMNDPINYVRQGALIASALVLVQQNDLTCSKASIFRQLYAKVINDKHEDLVAKFGAILAQGIIDAGGRNMTITLQSRSGHTDMGSVVGLLVFCQFWYWFPLSHFLSLAFRPTCIIALNSELHMPKLSLRSNVKPSMYAYPPPLEEKKGKIREKVETAVLSTTTKQQRRDADKHKEAGMEVDDDKDADREKDAKKKKTTEMVVTPGGSKTEEAKDEPELAFEMLASPARVMTAQLPAISMPDDARYVPLKDVSCGGIIMLRDLKPGETEDIIESVAAGGPTVEEGDEPEPPEPFEWNE